MAKSEFAQEEKLPIAADKQHLEDHESVNRGDFTPQEMWGVMGRCPICYPEDGPPEGYFD